MNVEYTGRQTTVTGKLRSQTEAGVERISRILGETGSVHVILTVDKYRHIAEVTLATRQQTLVATCEAADMEVALHDALAKIEQQAVRHNQKKTTIKRHPKSDLDAMAASPAPEV